MHFCVSGENEERALYKNIDEYKVQMKKRLITAILLITLWALSAQYDILQANQMKIKVSIVGAVEQPGIYKFDPDSRLSEVYNLLELQRKAINETAVLNEQESAVPDVQKTEYSLRKIKLKRGGIERVIDLHDYLYHGDMSVNPIIVDGDIIHLSPAEYNLEIYGEVVFPGEYELLAGDKISDLIDQARGLTEAARLDSAELVRIDYSSGEVTTIEFSPEDIERDGNSRANLQLQSGDRIYIRRKANYDNKYSVVVDGEAKYPGEYAIVPGKTTLYDILQQCGGAKSTGSVENGWLQRLAEEDSILYYDGEYARLEDRGFSELTMLELEYLKFKNRQMQGRIAADFAEILRSEGKEKDIYLQDNDLIYIPKKLATVEVSGAVLHPGSYRWAAGENYEYYIQLAGGFTNRARKTKLRVILEESGAWQKAEEEMPIQAGDQIFVPEKEEQDFWELTKETLSIMAQFATVVIAIINISTN